MENSHSNIAYEQREASSEVGERYLGYAGLLRWNVAFCRGESCIRISIPTMDLAQNSMIPLLEKAGEKGYTASHPWS